MKIIHTFTLYASSLLVALSPAFAETNLLYGYDKKQHHIESNLSVKRAIAQARNDSWIHQEQLAAAYLERAQLTGNFDDYRSAHQTIEKAFSLAEPGAGPFLTRSRINFTTHRLAQAQEDLSALEDSLLVDKKTQRHIKGMRADIHFQSGEYALAHRLYQELENANQSVDSAIKLAFYSAALGQHNSADNWFETAESRASIGDSHLRGWLKLQRGILDLHRGKLDDAKDHYQAGLALFPDYWLIEEHIAEIDTLQGRDRVAEKSYRDLIERTNSPLFMLALSDILKNREPASEREESAAWLRQAESIYRTRLQHLPEIVAGHALDYFIETARPEFTVSLAEENYKLRPNGEAALQLVQAYLKADNTEKAKPVLERALQSGYSSADLHMAASDFYRAADNSTKANKHYKLALKMNPSLDG